MDTKINGLNFKQKQDVHIVSKYPQDTPPKRWKHKCTRLFTEAFITVEARQTTQGAKYGRPVEEIIIPLPNEMLRSCKNVLHELIGSGFQAMLFSGEKKSEQWLVHCWQGFRSISFIAGRNAKAVRTAFLTRLMIGLLSNPAISI